MRAQQQVQQQEPPQPPAAKRTRMSKAAAAAAAAAVADVYTDIKTHSLVLRTHSTYVDRALGGEWIEAAERRVELTVADEQELEDLKLLIKLSYSETYTHDNGLLLLLAMRLRLAACADGLEFVEAVDQIVASLAEGLDFEGALACMAGLPPALEAHPGIAPARRGMATSLALGIGQREGKTGDAAKQELEAGVEALAKCLGPVAGMFEEGVMKLASTTLPLRADVKQLSAAVFKRLLASDALHLQLENEAFALLVAWLRQSPRARGKCGALFKELAPLLRYTI